MQHEARPAVPSFFFRFFCIWFPGASSFLVQWLYLHLSSLVSMLDRLLVFSSFSSLPLALSRCFFCISIQDASQLSLANKLLLYSLSSIIHGVAHLL